MTRTASDSTIAVMGLGYVAVPLAVEFARFGLVAHIPKTV